MKKAIALFLTLSLLLGFAAFGAQAEAPKEGPYKIAYLSALLNHTYFATIAQGMKERAAELGNITLAMNDANMDGVAMLNAMENFIADDYDALIISPVDGNQLEEATKKAREKGIVVLSQAQPVPGANLNYVVEEYPYGWAGGIQAGQWIKDHLNGEAEVAILTTGNIKELQQRAQGIEEGILSIAPNAKIVATQPGNLVELGLKATESILQAHPNVKVIAAVTDAGALGAYEAVSAAGKITDDFFIGGLDATQEALDKMMEEGSIFRATVDINPYGNGRELIDFAIQGIQNNGKLDTDYLLIPMIPVTQEQLREKNK